MKQNPAWRIWAKWVLALFLLVYTGICASLYLYQENLLFHPYTLPGDYVYKFPGRHREFNVSLRDGSKINALQFYTDSAVKGVVLYFHGNAEALDDIGSAAQAFTKRGYDCIMMDYPGYGKSTGQLSEQVLFDLGDAFVRLTKNQYSSGRVVIYGRSLGTGIAAHAARFAEWFKVLILEAPYYSMADMAQRRYPFLPGALLLRYPLSTYLYLKDLHHPVYAIHGTADRTIPIASPRRFLTLGLGDFHLIEVAGAGHSELAKYKEYDQLLDKVLN